MNLLSNLQSLNELALMNLAVERFEANRLLDRLSVALSTKIKRLTLINVTANHCSLPQIAMFSNLEVGLLCIDQYINQLYSPLQQFKDEFRRTNF